MKIIKTNDYEHMSQEAANIILESVKEKPDSVLGLATGSTPEGMYKKLILLYEEGKIDLKKCKTVNLDEYVGLPATHSQSFQYYMKHNFFDYVNIKKENTYFPDGMNENVAEENCRYMKILNELGGIDVQILGIGMNGHIGFNEPNDYFSKGLVEVKLEKSTMEANKKFFRRNEHVPEKAYTIGIQTIMSAKKIILMASGKEKSEILYEAICGRITPQIPASVLQLHQNVTIIADKEALSVYEERM